MKGGENMSRDLWTGLEHPFYRVYAEVWDKNREEYFPETIASVQTYEEAIAIAKKTRVSANRPQVKVVEETLYDSESVACKDAVTDNKRGYVFYDPRTDEDIK